MVQKEVKVVMGRVKDAVGEPDDSRISLESILELFLPFHLVDMLRETMNKYLRRKKQVP